MPTYIMLANWTQRGIQNIKDSSSRLETAKKLFKAMDIKLKDFYMVLGRYDTVAILEAPDDETAAKATLVAGSLGAVRTETLRAFKEEEYRKIIAALP